MKNKIPKLKNKKQKKINANANHMMYVQCTHYSTDVDWV